MRIAIRHETKYTYSTPPKSIIQILRLTPRSHEGQHVISWRIDCDADCRMKAGEDAYGNITHTFTVSHSVESLSLIVDGHVETFDAAGLVANSVERFPPYFFLRNTDLTLHDQNLAALAHDIKGKDNLDRMHQLMTTINKRMVLILIRPSPARRRGRPGLWGGASVRTTFTFLSLRRVWPECRRAMSAGIFSGQMVLSSRKPVMPGPKLLLKGLAGSALIRQTVSVRTNLTFAWHAVSTILMLRLCAERVPPEQGKR